MNTQLKTHYSKQFNSLSSNLKEKINRLFIIIDKDGDRTLDREETKKFWNAHFPKINTFEMFLDIDENEDNLISYDEWICYWIKLINEGHEYKEIEDRVNFLNFKSYLFN